jgi:putative endonuclease
MQDFRKHFGNLAEEFARKFLKSRGLKILTTNFFVRGGEVDIIARDGDLILFVEVKARRSDKFGSAIEAVDDAKIHRVAMAGQKFLHDNSLGHLDWRVDVIAIENGKLRWIKGV